MAGLFDDHIAQVQIGRKIPFLLESFVQGTSVWSQLRLLLLLAEAGDSPLTLLLRFLCTNGWQATKRRGAFCPSFGRIQ